MENIQNNNVMICAWCQKEFPAVNQAVQTKSKEGIKFSHGICKRHFTKMYADLGKQPDQDRLNALASIPDLAEHPELVQSYSQGNFGQNQTPLKERLQKLANIIKS